MIDYFLHVDLIVPTTEEAKFEQLMGQFMDEGGFLGVDPQDPAPYCLVLALKSLDRFEYSALGRFGPNELNDQAFSATPDVHRTRLLAGNQEVSRYVHLWSIPNLQGLDLAQKMIRSSENALYMQIHEHVASEVQNFARRVDWSGGLPVQDPALKKILRVVRQFTVNDIGPYLFNIGMLFPILQENGWQQLGQFQNVTGSLNFVTEFWQTDGDGTLDSMIKAAGNSVPAAIAAVKTLPVSDARESFERTAYSPKSQ